MLSSSTKENNETVGTDEQAFASFLGQLAHDMKEPIRTINSFTAILDKKLANDPDSKAMLAFVIGANNRMQTILEGLLGYMHTEKALRDTETFHLADILQYVAATFTHDARPVRISIDESVKVLPPIQGKKRHFQVIFNHLLSNTAKFNEQEVAEVNILGESVSGGMHLYFSDNGIGIPEMFLDEVFEPLRRLHPISKYVGSGLGLSTCRKLIDLYHGSISALPGKEQGTTIQIFLPF